jgi:hypothetical protein
LGKGKDIAENYNLSRDISQSSLKSIGYRGAAAAGQTVGAVSNSKLAQAASKLGDSKLGMKVKEVIFGTKKPQSMDQSLILSLKKAVDNSKHRLQAERDRQRKKREMERSRKLYQNV